MSLLASTKFAGASTPSAAIDTSGAKGLIAAFSSGNSSDVISDSASNTWIPLTGHTGAFGSVSRYFYVLNPITSGMHTFQCVAGVTPSAVIAAFSDMGAFDQENGTDGNAGGVPCPCGSITPANASNLMMAGFGGGSTTTTIDSGYSFIDKEDLAAGVNFGSALGYLYQVAASTQNPIWSDVFVATSAGLAASFALSGSGTAYTLTADAGSYTVTGTVVTFPRASKVSADAGSYLVTGTAATLTAAIHAHYTITALSGSYLITGTRATLRWSGAPPVTGNFPQCLNIAVMGL